MRSGEPRPTPNNLLITRRVVLSVRKPKDLCIGNLRIYMIILRIWICMNILRMYKKILRMCKKNLRIYTNIQRINRKVLIMDL